MRIQFARLALIAATALVLASATGCKSFKKWRGRPPYSQIPSGRSGLGGADGTGGGNFNIVGANDNAWTGTDKSLAGAGAGGLAANERRWEGGAVYFGFNRATIGASEQPKIEALASHLLSHPGYYVIVEGHCDSRGSDEYNRALGERRALAVRDYMANLGVDGARIRTMSYGEERPAVADATSEEQHALNRRAEFILGE